MFGGGAEYVSSATVAHYEAVLAAWQQQYQAAAQAATGQTASVPLLIDQISNWQPFCSKMQPTLCSDPSLTSSQLGTPEAVWKVAAQHSDSRSSDMRMAVSVLLLEHLLQYDFDTYFQRIVNRIECGAVHMRAMLSCCWGLTRGQHANIARYLLAEPHNKGLQPASSRVTVSRTTKRGSRSRRLKP